MGRTNILYSFLQNTSLYCDKFYIKSTAPGFWKALLSGKISDDCVLKCNILNNKINGFARNSPYHKKEIFELDNFNNILFQDSPFNKISCHCYTNLKFSINITEDNKEIFIKNLFDFLSQVSFESCHFQKSDLVLKDIETFENIKENDFLNKNKFLNNMNPRLENSSYHFKITIQN